MSQYGSQQYGQGQQDPSAGGYAKQEQDPSAGGYAGQEDPNQEDPAAGGYAQQDHSQLGGDPSADGQQNFNSQENGYGQGHAQQDSSQQGQMSNGFNAVAKHRQDANGTMTQARPGVSPKHAHYTPEHHNALHHAGQVAKKGFTAQHMDAAVQLGMYALGSLANTHGLAPEAPHPGNAQEQPTQ